MLKHTQLTEKLFYQLCFVGFLSYLLLLFNGSYTCTQFLFLSKPGFVYLNFIFRMFSKNFFVNEVNRLPERSTRDSKIIRQVQSHDDWLAFASFRQNERSWFSLLFQVRHFHRITFLAWPIWAWPILFFHQQNYKLVCWIFNPKNKGYRTWYRYNDVARYRLRV